MSLAISIGTALVALASLGLSGFALWLHHRDKGHANFTLDWDDRDTLVLVNHGPGPATDLEATYQHSEDLNVSYVPARQRLRMIALMRLMADLGSLDLTWRDNRRATQHLTLPVPDRPMRRQPDPFAKEDLEAAFRNVARGVANEEAERVIRRHGLGGGWV